MTFAAFGRVVQHASQWLVGVTIALGFAAYPFIAVAQNRLTNEQVYMILGTTQNLRGKDLSGLNLVGMPLGGTVLQDCNLKDANLRDVDLRGANLVGADLSGADLRGADLSGAILVGARLTVDRRKFAWRKV
jgi:uncharacterized protein YjbI with pentapeptide repeats